MENSVPPPVKPFLTITSDEQGRIVLQTNLPPEAKPLVLWMVEQAKLTILTQSPETQPQVKGINGGLARRMGLIK